MNKKYLWHLPNTLTIARPIIIFCVLFLFPLHIAAKILWYVGAELLDMFDGLIARAIGHTDGWGKILDPFADRIDKFMVLIFFYWNSLLPRYIIGSIGLGEFSVFLIIGFAVHLLLKENSKKMKEEDLLEIIKTTEREIARSWSVCIPGKLSAIFYFFVAVLVALRVELPKFLGQTDFRFLVFYPFVAGVIFRSWSIVIYTMRIIRSQ